MSEKTSIGWTDSTWNPLRGCAEISPGCAHCYAAAVAARFSGPGQPYEGLAYFDANGKAHWTGKVREAPEKLAEPFAWKKPRRVFVNSMSDLFHEDVPFEFIDKVFAVMASTGRHTYQVLTKRPGRAAEWYARVAEKGPIHANLYQSGLIDYYQRHGVDLTRPYQVPAAPTPELRFLYDSARGIDPNARIEDQSHPRLHRNDGSNHWRPWPLDNVHLGVSVEDQARADERIPKLLEIPAAVRFLSVEPMLGPIGLREHWYTTHNWHDWLTGKTGIGRTEDNLKSHKETGQKIDWIIVGGESGHGARPCDVVWIRSIVEQCKAAGVSVFVKQLGANVRGLIDSKGLDHDRIASILGSTYRLRDKKGGDWSEWPEDLRVREFPSSQP
jgi:protein gp37